IGRSTHHLELLAAVTHAAHPELIGIRMLLGTEDLAHHHTAELTGGRRYAVYLKARHGQARDQVVPGNLRVHPTAQPLFTEFHVLFLLSKGFAVTVSAKLGKEAQIVVEEQDRKSTRLNSSHVKISYAVFY